LSAVLATACATTKGTETGSAPETAAPTAPGAIAFSDPVGDDDGPGTYKYPTDAVYTPGSFDLTKFEVVPTGDTVEFRVTVNAKIEDPWASSSWGGNGFSTQMAFIFLDTDPGKPGVEKTLPGLNVRFAAEQGWKKAIIISPQGPTRLNSEIDQKAQDLKDKVIVPRVTRASGRTLTAIVGLDQLGGAPAPTWGYQVMLQSNEGFPAKTDLLTRKVNEYEGQHRFGGGTDYDNDPQVLDILVPPGAGGADEAKLQHELLSKFDRAKTQPAFTDLVVVPMVYPQGK
jgi:hypothetical protein